MKTKRLITTVAAIVAAITVLSAAALAISLPSAKPNAEPTPTPTPAPAAPIEESAAEPETGVTPTTSISAEVRDISKQEPTQEHLHFANDLVWLSEIEAQAREYRLAELARLECTHEDSLVFRNTDTNVLSAFCLDCGNIEINAESTAEPLLSSATIQAGCDHIYTSWSYINTEVHRKFCTLCSYTITERHAIVEADCMTSKHCTVCNGKDSTWEEAWGHIMGYAFDWNTYWTAEDITSDDAYIHEYRCVRCDNDLEYICDYVPIRETCTFHPHVYWTPESNGVHERYQVCVFCEMLYFLEDGECSEANWGISCPMCQESNEYS